MDVFSIIVLIGFIGACSLAAKIGAAYRPGDWYERLAKPRLAAAELVVSPSLDGSLSDHRRFRLAGMADVWFRGSPAAARDLSRAIGAECCLVTDLLRDAPSGPGIRGNRFALVVDRRDDSDFPTPQCSGCLAAAALSGLGHFCCGAQLHNLAHESRVSLARALISVASYNTEPG